LLATLTGGRNLDAGLFQTLVTALRTGLVTGQPLTPVGQRRVRVCLQIRQRLLAGVQHPGQRPQPAPCGTRFTRQTACLSADVAEQRLRGRRVLHSDLGVPVGLGQRDLPLKVSDLGLQGLLVDGGAHRRVRQGLGTVTGHQRHINKVLRVAQPQGLR
jgi:hypothetical protein